MNFFKFIKSKSPLKYEQKGDLHFASEDWGKAKLEYDSALDKLKREPAPDSGQVDRLKEKHRCSKEALSRQHRQSGDDLLDAGYPEEAREYYLLGLELSEDAQLRSLLENRLKKTELPVKGERYAAAPVELPVHGEVTGNEDVFADDETYFIALCNTLPVEVRKIYKSYGEPFQTGYIALNRGDFETALEALSLAQADHPSDGSYIALELATAYLNLEKYEAARALLGPFLQRHPGALPAYRMLCEIFWENGDYARAEHLLASVPQNLRDSQAFVLLYGENIYRQKRYSEAAAWYQTVLNTHGWNENIARALAVTLESTNQAGPARDLYGEIIQRCSTCAAPSAYPAHIDPFTRRRYAELSLAAGDHSTKILELFLSLVRDDPVNAKSYYRNISRIYSERGHNAEALRFQVFADKIETGGTDNDSGG